MNDACRYRIAAGLIAAAVIIPVALLLVLTLRKPDTVTADVLLYSPVGAQIPEVSLQYDEALFTKTKVSEKAVSILHNNFFHPLVVAPGSVSLVRDPNFHSKLHVLGRAKRPEVAEQIATTAAGVYVGALRGQFMMAPAVIPPVPTRSSVPTPAVIAVVVIAAVLATNGVTLLWPRTKPDNPGFTSWQS